MLIDVLLDVSATDAGDDINGLLTHLAQPEQLGAMCRRSTCVMPAGGHHADAVGGRWTVEYGSPVEACRTAMAAAADAESPLLILFGDVQPGAEAVGVLHDAMASDPMIGFAMPRLATADGRGIARLDTNGDRRVGALPRRVLAELPDSYLVADVPGRCLLVNPAVLGDFGELDTRFHTLAGALWHQMTRARRCGYRTVVSNRAVVRVSRPDPHTCSAFTVRSLPEADRVLLRELSPDVERTAREFGARAHAAAETRLARACPDAYGTPPSLLLDARNIVPGMNGTTVAALGVCRGVRALDAGWDVTLLVHRDACAFHDLPQLFADWNVVSRMPDRQFTATLRLSQPWTVQEMVDLHAAAAFNAYLFLDTISWDIAYTAPRNLTGTWQFMADHADALFFISDYTRDRFLRRFGGTRNIPHVVSYLSFDADDYVRADVHPAPAAEPFIFVVGNQYDHKDVGPATELLATAFPYERIVALGLDKPPTPRVTSLESGNVSDAEMHRLYASARCVVFPSFYEGFGLPILTTLAYGGTVIARRSALLDEIAAHSGPRGRIVPYGRRDELVDVVGQLLHGEDVATLRTGSALGDRPPMSWRDVAARMLTCLDELSRDLGNSQWRARERSIRQLLAAPTSLTEKGLASPATA